LGTISFGLFMFGWSFWIIQRKKQNTNERQSKPFPRSITQRGQYMNSGSKDIGPDKTFEESRDK